MDAVFQRVSGGHYAVLEVARDATSKEVRQVCMFIHIRSSQLYVVGDLLSGSRAVCLQIVAYR